MECKKSRLTVWRHAGGRAAAVSAIKEVIIIHAALLAEKTINLTSTDEFKSWVWAEELTAAKALLKDLFELDPRGALFRQEDMAQAVEQGLRTSEFSMDVIEKTRYLLCTPTEVFSLIAYKIRILCAGMRIHCKASAEFSEFKQMMETAPACASIEQEKT